MTGRSHGFPTFLIIGAQKSATRWLRFNLGRHPGIFTADAEIEFFNKHWEKGPNWYRERFDAAAGETVVGEATPGYMMWNERPVVQAARIDGLLPGVRLVAMLRNPVDRAYSAFLHHMRAERIPPHADLVTFVDNRDPRRDPFGLISGGWYGRSLRPYVERFGPALLILLHDDVQEDPERAFTSAVHHVGADAAHVPPELSRKRFVGKAPAGTPHAGEGGRRPLTPDERDHLFSYFAEDVAELEQLADLDLSRWRTASAEPVQRRASVS